MPKPAARKTKKVQDNEGEWKIDFCMCVQLAATNLSFNIQFPDILDRQRYSTEIYTSFYLLKIFFR